jgi:hypothetical protein
VPYKVIILSYLQNIYRTFKFYIIKLTSYIEYIIKTTNNNNDVYYNAYIHGILILVSYFIHKLIITFTQ